MNPILAAIFIAAAQVTNSTPLTGVRDSYPSLSPDGRTLLFHSNRSGRQAIWAAGPDGSNPRLLFDDPASGIDPGTPSWSPDGRFIAFAMQPAGAVDDEESDIYLIASDGSGLRRLTEALGDDSHPVWSSDGRIFFNSARATLDPGAPWSRQWIDIYSMAADGSDVRRHTYCRTVCTYPAPSPDGRWLAYRAVTDSLALSWDLMPGQRNSEVFVVRLDGGDPVNVSNDPAFDGWPTWSRGSGWIVFASNRDRIARTGQVYAVRPDGSGLHAVSSGLLSRVQPRFTADGARLLVNQSIQGENFEMGQIAALEVQLEE